MPHYTPLRTLTSFGSTEVIEIPRSEIGFEQRQLIDGGFSLHLDLINVTKFGVPLESEVSVVSRDNHHHVRDIIMPCRSFRDVLADGTSLDLPLREEIHPEHMEVIVYFTKPGDSKMIAVSAAMRVPDTRNEVWQGGKSFFRTRPERSLKRPVTPVMDPEGPLFLFGETGPLNGEAAAADLSFVLRDCISGVEKFLTHLLLGDHESYDTVYWEQFKKRVAELMAKRSFDDLKESSTGRVEETVLEVCEAFYRDPHFKSLLKQYAQQQSAPATNHEDI